MIICARESALEVEKMQSENDRHTWLGPGWDRLYFLHYPQWAERCNCGAELSNEIKFERWPQMVERSGTRFCGEKAVSKSQAKVWSGWEARAMLISVSCEGRCGGGGKEPQEE